MVKVVRSDEDHNAHGSRAFVSDSGVSTLHTLDTCLLSAPPMEKPSSSVSKALAKLGKLPRESSTIAEIVSNEAVAKRYMNCKKQTPATVQAKCYAKAWLALQKASIDDDAIDAMAVSAASALKPFVHDSSMANVLLGPGKGQLVRVVETDDSASPKVAADKSERKSEKVDDFILRSAWKWCLDNVPTYLARIPKLLDRIVCACIVLTIGSFMAHPGLAVICLVGLLKAVPNYACWCCWGSCFAGGL